MEMKENRTSGTVLHSVFRGAIGAILFTIAAFILSLLLGRRPALTGHRWLMVRGLLLICAIISGVLGVYKTTHRRIVYALSGEISLIVLCLTVCVAARCPILSASCGIDLVLMLIGAFAGTILGGKKRHIQYGKRVYGK